jgi:hypothetical protein
MSALPGKFKQDSLQYPSGTLPPLGQCTILIDLKPHFSYCLRSATFLSMSYGANGLHMLNMKISLFRGFGPCFYRD